VSDECGDSSNPAAGCRAAGAKRPCFIQAHPHASRTERNLLSDPLQSMAKPRVGGACLWAGIDCQRGYSRQPFYGGVLDLFRLPKFNHHFFPQPGFARRFVCRVWTMVQWYSSRNFATFLSPTSVTIFSNCDEVRLRSTARKSAANKPGMRAGRSSIRRSRSRWNVSPGNNQRCT